MVVRALLRRRAVRVHRERLVVAALLVEAAGLDGGGSSSSRTSEGGRREKENNASSQSLPFIFLLDTLPHTRAGCPLHL